MIPVQWRLEGVDLLGDEFVCNQTYGTLQPNQTFELVLHFRALKPLIITPKEKKILKLLVSDVNGFLGFMENHSINVIAEAYDVALEINLPKGNDGGLEFGTVRVNTENKQICNLKNKGKYPIKYNFIVESAGEDIEEIKKYLSVVPSSGDLFGIQDRNAQHQQVQVIINTAKEINIKDAPVLKCQIIEPTATDCPVIANIPIKISCKAVFSKYNIVPQSEINFGVLNLNSKRQERIIIENKGEFDFKFTVSKFFRESVKLSKSSTVKEEKSKQREGSSQTKTTTKRNDSVRDGGAAQGRLQVGVYTITPAYGLILQNGFQTITIDCAPETTGVFEEELTIDITDRNTNDSPNGIIYKLVSEATVPSLSISPEIFEEHTIVQNTSAIDSKTMGIGIYCEEENKFIFNNVIVGRTAKARFKILNNNKIPIDIGLQLKSGSKTAKVHEVFFDVEPPRVQIQPHSHSFVIVSFTPQAMTSYSTTLEASLENVSSSLKNKSITFEIIGEGNLPRFTIAKPTLRNVKGQHLLRFKRSVLNHIDTQPLVLTNDGTIATKINFYMNDPDGVFKIKPDNKDQKGIALKDNGDSIASVLIHPNEQLSFNLSCIPKLVQHYEGTLQLTVTDNQFEDTVIQLVGEGYLEDITLDNLHSINAPYDFEDEILGDEDVTAMKCNSLSFGDVFINEGRQLLFTMTNRNKTMCYRFEWPDQGPVSFSPRVGHLHAGCAKDITIIFRSTEPKYMKKEVFKCNFTKITFDQPISEIKDWDDRMTVVKWVNEAIPIQQNTTINDSNNRPTSASVVTSIGTAPPVRPTQIIKKKVIEVEPEPKHTKLEEQVTPLDLYVSVNCDYCKYKCNTHVIRFKDTLMFQTRVYEVTIQNRGKIQLDYNWKVNMEDIRRPFTPMIEPDSPTPEPSPSPRGRASKVKSGDASTSPTRKPGKDALNATIKKESKDGKGAGKKTAASNGTTSAKDSLDDTIKKGSKGKGKDKDSKDGDDTMSKKELSDLNLKSAAADVADMTMKSIDDSALAAGFRPESQAQMRAESSLSVQAPSIMTETGYIPFNIEPAFGKIEVGKSQTFKIKFAPLNVNDYQARLICNIPNLEETKPGPIVAVRGRGTLPYCHFDLEESDYLMSGRRDPELTGPAGAASGLGLDIMTKVIEFKSVGLSNKCIKKFNIINPTNTDYEFEWIKEDQNTIKKRDQFECIVKKGLLRSGRREEMIFEFEPLEVGIQESFWQFKIDKYNLRVPFLLVGEVTEPKVVFDRSYVLFKPLLLGMTGRETVTLINQENRRFEFNFDVNSCYTEGRSAVVLVTPATGTIEPNQRIPVELTLTPHEQKQLTFNMKCNLSNSSKPLKLNVKGEGFSLKTNLYCEDPNGEKVEFSEDGINEIHLGEVEKNQVTYRNLYLLNSGKHPIDFDCYLNSQLEENFTYYTIEPARAHVEPGEKVQCVLKYFAKKEKLTSADLIIKVDHGSIYRVFIDGIAVRPDLQFSFTNYSFGPCFIYKAGMPIQSAKLDIKNTGFKDINVECLFDNTKSCFTVDFKQTILMPNESTTAIISFIPRDCIDYNEKISFELNGLTKREVYLQGTGTDMKVELVDNKQKVVDIGTLQIGKQSKKILKVINKSMAPIEFNILHEAKSEILALDKSILQIEPNQKIKLKANQVLDLQVTFTPRRRIPKFYEEINIEYNGICIPLCALTGACHGYNIWTEMNTISFGAVVQKCSTTRRLVMHNDGDIGASFKWEIDRMKPEFSIYPVNGYISAGMEVHFDITFSPTEISQDIRKDNVRCILEGCSPLTLTLIGSCIQVIPQKDIQHFETFVRQKEVKQIAITNKTNSLWDIKPLIEGEYFSGLESFTIEPQVSKTYDITYYPLTMTTDGKKHTGSCFFPLPDGTGLLYNLNGIAGPPKCAGKVTKDVPCKVSAVELLIIENWLKKPQRFKVTYEYIKPDKPDLSTVIKGHDYVDVPPNGKKEYKVNFFAHKEGITQIKVIFTNEQTGEYIYYEISFRAIKGGSVGTIDLTTAVRVPISYSLKLENPLPNSVTFTATCSNTTEVLIPSNLQITAKGQGDFFFEYLPLKVGEMTAKLELVSVDLGICVYDLNLRASAPAPERPIYVKSTLGSSQAVQAKFVNFCKQKTDYSWKSDNPDFKISEKNIPSAPSQTPSGIEIPFEIVYEPSNLGEIRATITLSSVLGGDYVIPVYGTCLPPKPQGPFIIKANGNASIPFKNVFNAPLQYTFAIDNPLFHVKSTEVIKANQTHKIFVSFHGNDSPTKADVMAKLIVTPPKLSGLNTNVQWIYYLKGVTS